MGRKRIDVSPLKPRVDRNGIHSLALDSSLNAGDSIERTRVRFEDESLPGDLMEDRVGTAGEGANMPQILIETTDPTTFELVEARSAPGTGKMVARGEFGRCGVPTLNGRIYSESLMGREIKRLKEDLKSRRVLGQLDHPENGKSSLKSVSHVITDLWIESDGRVMGEAEILNTTEGKNLRALVEAQIPVPVSSRGFGSTKPATGKQEGEEVQDDFVLKTYDFVADPAVRTAVPQITMESVDDPTAAEMFLQEFPDVAQQLKEAAIADAVTKAKDKVTAGVDAAVEAAEKRVRKEMTEAFEQRLADVLVEAREDLSAQLKEDFAADPSVGAAKATLSQIAEMVGAYRQDPDAAAVRDAMKAKDVEIAERTKERDEAVEAGLQASMLLIVERQIGGHPMAEAVRSLLKNVKLGSVAEVEAKLALIREHLPEEEAGISESEVQLREDNATLRGEVSLLQDRVGLMDEKLKRAVELSQAVNAQLKEAEDRVEEMEAESERLREELSESKLKSYKAAKVAGLANSRSVLGLLEGVSSEADVDKVVAMHGAEEVSDGELREMRRKLQRGHGDARDLDENLERPQRSHGNDADPFGNSMDVMRKLSGFRE